MVRNIFMALVLVFSLIGCGGGGSGSDGDNDGDVNRAPTAGFTATPVSGQVPVTVAFNASASSDPDGDSLTYAWSFGDGANGTGVTTNHPYAVAGSYTASLTVSDGRGGTHTVQQNLNFTADPSLPPPDPASVAPALDPTLPTTVFDSTVFLYTGDNPIQTGVVPGTIVRERAAVLRGKVTERDGAALSGVKITIVDHPEFGRTLTRTDGMFDMVVNGGGLLTVRCEKDGYLIAQRQVNTPWNDYTWIPDVVLTALSIHTDDITLQSAEPVQVARGPVVTDDRGERQSTLLVPGGTGAHMVLSGGGTQAFTSNTLTLRATEYTQGEEGLPAMPEYLPPGVAYTYCVDLSVDEALAAGATSVVFNKTLYHYVDNFLGYPVGEPVPNYYYDRDTSRWLLDSPGIVIEILDTAGGMATIDSDGDGTADDGTVLDALGFTTEERTRLASLYPAGKTLWRVPLTHFSPRDYNWRNPEPPVRPENTVGEPQLPPNVQNPCSRSGSSVVECQNQVLGESIPIAGTAFSLNYRSDRAPGRRDAMGFEILILPDPLPEYLEEVTVEVTIAGQRHVTEPVLSPGQFYSFTWDGKDAYGRTVEGQMPARIRVGYKFGLPSPCGGVPDPLLCPPAEPVFWAERAALLGARDMRGVGLGGWTLSPHHLYDPRGPVLYQGDGRTRQAMARGAQLSFIPVAGGGEIEPVDPIPAFEARLHAPRGLAFGPDGSLYIVLYSDSVILKMDRSGVISTVAGAWDSVTPVTDGGLATGGYLDHPSGIAVAPDGSFFFSVVNDSLVYRVDPDGIITIVAGTGEYGYSGDGGSARAAQLAYPQGLALAPDGSLFIADTYNHRIRKVDPFGIITTVAGSSTWGYAGDGGPATEARLRIPADVALGEDGSLYIADAFNYRIRKVTPEGIITTVAGNGQRTADVGWLGDGGLATAAAMEWPTGIAVDRDGSMFISCSEVYAPTFKYPEVYARFSVIRKVSAEGIITTLPKQIYSGFWAQDDLTGIVIGPDGVLYSSLGIEDLGHGYEAFIRQIRPALPGDTWNTALLASDQREEVYKFEGNRHIATLSSRTGAMIYAFGYDDAGFLSTVTDAWNNVLAVERDGAGNPTAIVAPGGQRTTLSVDGNHFLSTIADPAGNAWALTHSDDGLLTRAEDPNHHASEYDYDEQGLLVETQDAAGGGLTLVKEDIASGRKITTQTAEGVQTQYATQWFSNSVYQVNIGCCGTVWSDISSMDRITAGSGDGSSVTALLAPHPQFQNQTPYMEELLIETPGGRSFYMERDFEIYLDNPSDAFSLNQYREWVNIGDPTSASYRKEFDPADRMDVMTSPTGRVRSISYNDQGRIIGSQHLGLASTNIVYDIRGRIQNITSGNAPDSRMYSFSYGADGNLSLMTDPMNRTLSFTRDAAGRVSGMTLPGGRSMGVSRDARGNLTLLTTPSGHTHGFTWSPVNKTTAYTPPTIAGAGPTGYMYDLDRRPVRISRPDGINVDLTYDVGGRPLSVTWPGHAQTYEFDDLTRHLRAVTAADGGKVAFGYDGPLPNFQEWTGTVAGRVDFDYNERFQLNSIAVNGNAIPLILDRDGLITAAGGLSLTRDATTGRITGASLGVVSDTRAYNPFSEVTGYSAAAGSSLYAYTLTRDFLGRVTRKLETVEGVSHTYDYSYNEAGMLVEVSMDGGITESYAYDSNGNRITTTNSAGMNVAGSYDSQDRLISMGSATYAYTAAGELTGRTQGGQTTHYTYDVLGNLLQVDLPDGTGVIYLSDGLGRRIGKQVDGVLEQGFLYQDRLNPVAELDGSGNVVSRFVYGSMANVPDYMIREGVSYRILSDPSGSVRLVVRAGDGAVVQRMDYDSFGRVLADTNPGFQPFGFAGGIYDPDTGLVRFGARDYDPETGRWTAKDSIGFMGGDTNLYSYVSNDPVNQIDPEGTVLPIVAAALGLALGSDAVMAIALSPVVAAEAIDFVTSAASTSGLAPYLDAGPGPATIGTGFGAAAGAIVGGVIGSYLDWIDTPSTTTSAARSFANDAEAWNDDYERQVRELQDLFRPCP
jgi:RHS repeat-associated protein